MQIVQDCMSMLLLQLCVALLSFAILFGCGENIESPEPSDSFGPPQDLKALSVNDSTVSLQWSAAVGASDSLFQGYIVQWDSNQDSVETLSYRVDSLSPGQKEFMVRSFKTDGLVSDVAVIRWAPAARFDSPYIVHEFNLQDPTTEQGFGIGSQTDDPSTMLINANAQQTMDLYCFGGGSSQIAQPLGLWSADLFQGSWHSTRFSSVTSASTSLDYYLSSFPDASTFTRDSVAVINNTIYYVRFVGNNQQLHYARLHIRVVPGFSFPTRRIEIRVSLQRVPGLLFALESPSAETRSPFVIPGRQLAIELTSLAYSLSMPLRPLTMIF